MSAAAAAAADAGISQLVPACRAPIEPPDCVWRSGRDGDEEGGQGEGHGRRQAPADGGEAESGEARAAGERRDEGRGRAAEAVPSAAPPAAGARRSAAAAGLARRTCEPGRNQAAVRLRVSQGETLRYEVVVDGPHGSFVIADEGDTVILSDRDPAASPGRYVRVWPGAGDSVGPGNEVSHSLGLTFLGAISYTWTITRVAASGAAVATLKRCRYERTQQTDVFFDALSIFTV